DVDVASKLSSLRSRTPHRPVPLSGREPAVAAKFPPGRGREESGRDGGDARGELLQEEGPAALGFHGGPKVFPPCAMAVEVAVFEVNAGRAAGLGRETHLDLAGTCWIGLVAPLGRDLPGDDEAPRGIPDEDPAPIGFGPVGLVRVASASRLPFE